MRRLLTAALLLAGLAAPLRAEDVKIVTYNVEHWADRFDAKEMRAAVKAAPPSEELTKLIESHVAANEKFNWAVATVIQAMSPDIMVFEEGCNQEDLNYFGHRWLQDAYETLRVFPTNTGARNQNIGLIAKPGFKVLKILDKYYLEKDSVPKPFVTAERNGEETATENRLFARGPAFVLIQTPGGKQFWMGVNHQKSKSGNSLDVAKWRNREATRIHEIIKELQKTGPAEVVFAGDMNDELGMQEFEQEAGGDSIEMLVGPPADGFVLVTRKLADNNAVSFGGYWSTRYRSLIDHFVVTPSLKDNVAGVRIFKEGLAPIASDHFPVMMTLKF